VKFVDYFALAFTKLECIKQLFAVTRGFRLLQANPEVLL